MRVALASCFFRNGEIAFNLAQAERFAREAAASGAALVVFGETFLQGFDSLSWDWETDRAVALSQDDPPLRALARLSAETGTDICVGYVERDGESLYSSAALYSGGRLLRNYRRVSPGWREVSRTDGHYREGDDTGASLWRGRLVKLALCGDMWTCPERFAGCEVLLWPVYVSFTEEEWACEETLYALRAASAAPDALLVNPLSRDSVSLGGACHFRAGRVHESLPRGREGLLIVEI